MKKSMVMAVILACMIISAGYGDEKEQMKSEMTASWDLVQDALEIIDNHLVIGENLTIKSTGSEGEIMRAYRLLKQASDLQPDNLDLRYATICALRLSSQFDSAHKEMADFSEKYPDYALAKFTLEGWEDEVEGIAPAIFRYSQFSSDMKELPPFYARFVKTITLLPARENIYSRAVLFLKDNESYWTKDMLKNAKVEIAVVYETLHPDLVVVYARFLLPDKKPDLHEEVTVLGAPKSDSSIAGLFYLCLQDFLDVVVIDNQKNIIFNQRIKLPEETKATLANIKKVLLNTQGSKLSKSKFLSIVQRFQNANSLDDIERKYFPPK